MPNDCMNLSIERGSRILDRPLEMAPRFSSSWPPSGGPAILLPLWTITLVAPQHPQGLRLEISSDHLAVPNGDLDQVNALHRAIGMREPSQRNFTEFPWIPFVLGRWACSSCGEPPRGLVTSSTSSSSTSTSGSSPSGPSDATSGITGAICCRRPDQGRAVPSAPLGTPEGRAPRGPLLSIGGRLCPRRHRPAARDRLLVAWRQAARRRPWRRASRDSPADTLGRRIASFSGLQTPDAGGTR